MCDNALKVIKYKRNSPAFQYLFFWEEIFQHNFQPHPGPYCYFNRLLRSYFCHLHTASQGPANYQSCNLTPFLYPILLRAVLYRGEEARDPVLERVETRWVFPCCCSLCHQAVQSGVRGRWHDLLEAGQFAPILRSLGALPSAALCGQNIKVSRDTESRALSLSPCRHLMKLSSSSSP